ncbi:ribonuclease P protein subunit p30-like [Styela clava]|uniref:ribonuclease P protein subunit p30-like n=1 Tax=Styela clava TaxID=7725 RepID=UPI00193A69F5|nr:ribonuclease P protein subunit p30-like [Styela clava]
MIFCFVYKSQILHYMKIIMSHLPIPPKGCFYDLNVPYDENQKHMDSVLTTFKELGYSVLAFSKYIPSGSLKRGGKKKRLQLPTPPDKVNFDGITQLSRITIELSEVDDQITVRDVITHGGFDIIAVEPKTEKLFLSACTQLNIDIITFDGAEKLSFFLRTHQVRAAIARGIHFEFNYSPMVRDPTMRKLTTTCALRLVECCKSKNIIMSSKSLHPLELRGPYDVANLGILFTMKESMVPHLVSHNCRCVVVHSFARKTAKGAVFIQKIESSDSNMLKRQAEICDDEAKKAKLEL